MGPGAVGSRLEPPILDASSTDESRTPPRAAPVRHMAQGALALAVRFEMRPVLLAWLVRWHGPCAPRRSRRNSKVRSHAAGRDANDSAFNRTRTWHRGAGPCNLAEVMDGTETVHNRAGPASGSDRVPRGGCRSGPRVLIAAPLPSSTRTSLLLQAATGSPGQSKGSRRLSNRLLSETLMFRSCSARLKYDDFHCRRSQPEHQSFIQEPAGQPARSLRLAR